MQTGYTLVESVVAIFVLSVGGLALASTSGVIGRELNANATRERAARLAANRIEILAALCEGAAGGSETTEGVRLSWAVSHSSVSSIAIELAVDYFPARGRRSDRYTARLRC